MDKGTHAKNVLYGYDIPLKFGYVGVKGRSQHDIISKISVKEGLETEKKFFASHPVYSTMPTNIIGTDALIQKLTKIFYNHIKSVMPDIYQEVLSMITESEERLKELGTPLPSSESEKTHFFWQVITQFCEAFKIQLTGKYDMKAPPEANDASSALTIRQMYSGLFSEFMNKKFHASMEYKDADIERAITQYEGDNLSGFPSIDAFIQLLQPQLERLKEPTLELLNNVYSFLEELAIRLINKQLQR